MTVLTAIRRGLAPLMRPTYKAGIIAAVEGKLSQDAEWSKALEGRPESKIKLDIQTYQARRDASAFLRTVPELEAQEKVLVDNYRVALASVDEAKSANEVKAC